jgi:hypothetical protein
MPGMKRFLTRQVPSGPSHSAAAKKSKQQRLSQCKKVVKLSASKYVVIIEDLKQLRQVLEDSGSDEGQLLKALRTLDSLVLHSPDLVESQVGRSVKKLRKHESLQVSTLAARLTEKWRDIVLRELIPSEGTF